jgi:cytochrome c biogenesis protein CcmG/thiol:disulfide interchange protein DsbE
MKLAWWRYSLPLLAFVGIAVFLALGLRNEDPRLVPSPFIGKPAPYFRLPELRDRARWVASDDFKGKPFVVNVWASWCVACRDDHPGVTALAQSGLVTVVGLNWKDDRGDAMRWLERYGDPYAHIAHDPIGRTAIDFGVYGAPETFLIDANGIVQYKHVGPLTPDVIEREFVSRLKRAVP